MRITIPQEWVSKLTVQQQLLELDNEVKCKLGVSSVHGVGVFAMRDIPHGERCYCTPRMIPRFYTIPFGSLSKLFPEVKELILQRWASVVNHSLFCSPNDDAHLLMFVNHSTDPNYDVVSDTALKDIRKGEELFENYRMMDNWMKVRPLKENQWLTATNVTNPKSMTNFSVVNYVKQNIKRFAQSWIHVQKLPK